MLISRKWLQNYFETELPSAEEIANTLLLHSFEIEEVKSVAGDSIIDIDVLPNRAHDCLCYQGVAQELSGLLNIPLKEDTFENYLDSHDLPDSVPIKLENKDQCTRYIGALVKNIEVRESPNWLQEKLAAMGQKSINALVDATNYVMFDRGQPMHVFDADKITGGITIRNARAGEVMTALTGEELVLQESDLLICDDVAILALAGVKGGTHAEVTTETKNIIIESAHFNPLTTRKTARRVKILTDSSKRYENEITAEKAGQAMNAMVSLVFDIVATTHTEIVGINDVYPEKELRHELIFSYDHVKRLLGLDISRDDIHALLERFSYSYFTKDDACHVLVPFERLDLRIAEDMIEEIGRLYGYDKIPSRSVDELDFTPEINKFFAAIQKIKNYFIEQGFTEIMNYSFVNKGNVELRNPLASDKKSLRKNLATQMKESLVKNARTADFVNVDQVLNFEIDVIHGKQGEETWCCFGIDTLSKKSRKQYGDEQSQIEKHIDAISKMFGLSDLVTVKDGNIVSFHLDQCAESTHNYDGLFDIRTYQDEIFAGISIYPYMKRDISFWATDHDMEIFEKAIRDAGAEFLQKVFLFDEFEKDGKTSYAFSIIFQSFEKTLTDIEVEKDMEKINQVVINLGGEIR